MKHGIGHKELVFGSNHLVVQISYACTATMKLVELLDCFRNIENTQILSNLHARPRRHRTLIERLMYVQFTPCVCEGFTGVNNF